MNAIVRNCSILGFLVTVGCVTHRQAAAFGRWTVSGTDDVVTLARHHSARLTRGDDPVILHTLAAAYAENGQFSQAIAAAQEALKFADERGVTPLVESLRNKIILYQAGSAYHELTP